MQRFIARNALLLAVIFGLIGTLFLYLSVQRLTRERAAPVPMATVLVAKVDIPTRTVVNREQVMMKEIPATVRHPKGLTAVGDAVGKYAIEPIYAGEQVLSSRVADRIPGSTLASRVPEGRRAVGINVTEAAISGGLIGPGDRVDVLAVFKQDRLGFNTAAVVLQDIEVLAVAQNIGGREEDRGKKEGVLTSGGEKAKTVTLAVTLDEAQRLALAEEFGVLRLALRRTDDTKLISSPQEISLNAVAR